MRVLSILWVLLCGVAVTVKADTYCVCTTVPCPQPGENHIIMGNGYANMTYFYEDHQGFPVVVKAQGILTPESLNQGTETTTCTRKYARMLEDDGEQTCDAGHILANRLGGYGNEPLNIFPQNSTINQGIYNQFEGKIYDCIQSSQIGYLQWDFFYENTENTQPYKVTYSAEFDESSECAPLNDDFSN